MSLQSDILANLTSVQADMNYLAPMLERPRNYTYEPTFLLRGLTGLHIGFTSAA